MSGRARTGCDALDVIDAAGTARLARRPWATLLYVGVAICLMVVVWQSSEHLSQREAGLTARTTLAHGDHVLGPWLFWDAGAYTDIAEHGYTTADVQTFHDGGEARVAFFPGYPMAVRAVSAVLGDTPTALIVVTLGAGLLLSFVVFRWFERHVASERGARLAFVALLLFPWAYFLVATGYSDALFLLLAVGAFLLLEDDRPVMAGLVGALASATRIVGVAVVIGLILRALERREAIERDGWRVRIVARRLRARDLGVLMSGIGLLSYMGYCWSRYGDPFAFSTAQRGWGSPRGIDTWIKRPLFDMILHLPDTWFVLRLVLQGLVGLAFLAAVPAVWRRHGRAYGTYTLLVVALPLLGASAFQSGGRHMLAAFPVFALLGESMTAWSPRRVRAWMIASGLALVAWASFWSRGYWMG